MQQQNNNAGETAETRYPQSLGNSCPELVVIKIGGNVIDNPDFLNKFLKDIATIDGQKILVHGGGKIATKIGEKLGIAPQYINGRRITDDETIGLVTMVYGGLVNKKIVAQLQALQCNAIGLTGADGNAIPAVKRPVKKMETAAGVQDVDFGWVGDVRAGDINVGLLQPLLESGVLPVFAPLTHDGAGNLLNTNADTVASAIAIAFAKKYTVRLVYCFEKKGVLENVDDETSVIKKLDKNLYKNLLSGHKLFEGILPKIDNAFAAIDAGVQEVVIGDAQDVIQNCTTETAGTFILR